MSETTKKLIYVERPDGSIWSVPAHLVADHRAKHYAEIDADTTYEAEYEFTVNDEYELLDWAENNMNWSDVVSYAVEVEVSLRAVEYQEGWVNGRSLVVGL